jgi:Na+/melibiose symporter-like transporter
LRFGPSGVSFTFIAFIMSSTVTMTRGGGDGRTDLETFELGPKSASNPTPDVSRRLTTNSQRRIEPGHESGEATSSDALSQVASQPHQQCWNKPTTNVGRLGFCFVSFIIAGMNDAATGALIPYYEEYYNLNYTIVSLIFLTPFAGYAAAAFANAWIHARYGQRGIAVAAPVCHIVTYIILCTHPPFAVVVVINMFSGFGNGLTDACFCAWIGVMENPNAVQGILHSCYSVGALLAPLIATSMITKYDLPWWNFYYVMVCFPYPHYPCAPHGLHRLHSLSSSGLA